MNNLKYFCLLSLTLMLMLSCKKDKDVEPVVPETEAVVNYSDSISFTLDNQLYIVNETNSLSIGNRGVNIKPYDELIQDRKPNYVTADKFWYGAKDSTQYYFNYDVGSISHQLRFNITFIKNFKNSDLQNIAGIMYPKDRSELFKLGKQAFAEDVEKENTMDGISIDVRTADGKTLGTKIPGFNIFIKSKLTNVQENSIFNIIRLEKIKEDIFVNDDLYMLEATFKINLLDENEKVYRVEDGFLRKMVRMSARFN